MHDFVQKSGALTEIRDVMLEYSKPVRDQQRFEELNERIAELQGSSHDLKAITRERDALAEGVDARKEAVARYNTFLKARTDDIVKKSGAGVANDPAVSLYHEIINKCDGLRKLRDGEEGMALAEQDCIRLIKSAAYTSLPISEILPANGMERARDKLRKLAEQGKYRIPDDQERFDKDAVLGSMLRDPYQPDPDKMVGDYFAARDGIAPSAPGALPRIQQRPSMAHLEMGVTFKQPVSTQQLRAQVLAPFIEAQRWDDATRLQVLPAESGALQSQRFTVSTTDMGSEEAIGVSAIVRSVVQSLQGTIGNARRDAGVTAAAV